MEHRWGWRVRVDQAARIVGARASIHVARVRDLSTSGAFLETTLKLPVFTSIDVQFLLPRRGRMAVTVPAHVIRATADGLGVEWCEFNPPVVAQLLHEALEMREKHAASPAAASEARVRSQ